MAFRIEVYPYTKEELISDVAAKTPEVIKKGVETNVFETPAKGLARELKPKDIYDFFNGKTGVTLALANNYEWKWTWSGATAGSEVTLIEVPASVLRDWTRSCVMWYLVLYQPTDDIAELRFYKQNNIGVTVNFDFFDIFNTSMIRFKPEVWYDRTETSMKITAVVRSADGTVRFALGGLVSLPIGESGEPNPLVISTAKV